MRWFEPMPSDGQEDDVWLVWRSSRHRYREAISKVVVFSVVVCWIRQTSWFDGYAHYVRRR